MGEFCFGYIGYIDYIIVLSVVYMVFGYVVELWFFYCEVGVVVMYGYVGCFGGGFGGVY